MGDPGVQSKERASFPTHVEQLKGRAPIIDIRSDKEDLNLATVLKETLHKQNRHLPDLLLWDEAGLKLFEEVTYTPEYYLTAREIGVLEAFSNDIAACIDEGTMLIELGSGNLRKVKILLDACERQGKKVDYYALDVSESELQRTLEAVHPDTYKNVTINGLLGTYDDGKVWLKTSDTARGRPKCFLSLGSTIGSFNRNDAAQFVRDFTDGTSLLLGIDGCKNGAEVYQAYNDSKETNKRFIANGLKHANKVLGYEAFKDDEWKVEGRWNESNGSHDWYYIPLKDMSIEGVHIKGGEEMKAVRSHKYDNCDRVVLFEKAGVEEKKHWQVDSIPYGLYLVTRSGSE